MTCATRSPSNLCRCTGYQRIIDAVLDAAARLRKAAEGAP